MDWKLLLAWPPAHLRHIGGVVLAGMTLLLIDSFLAPGVDAIYPVELNPAVDRSVIHSDSAFESADFVTRPLFLTSRRAAEPVTIEEAIIEPASPQSELSLEGVSLLGVFASGEEGGAIIELEDGNRTRLFIGEALDGWTLEETGLRGVVFRSATGATESLELAVASSLPRLEATKQAASPPAQNTAEQKVVEIATPATEGEQLGDKKAGMVSFDSVWDAKKAALEQRSGKAADQSADR